MAKIREYTLIEPPFDGGMALVYKGVSEDGTFKRAFKMVRPDKAANNPRLCERFLKEIRVQHSLNHPNIINILGAYPYTNPAGDTMTVLEMEWLDGMDLQRYVKEKFPNGLDASTVIQIAHKVIDGLEYAHKHNVLHLDVKPSNIFRTNEGYIKIIDFGIAKVIGENPDIVDGAEEYSTKTETGESSFRGTTGYASPEQQVGAKLSFTSDIYSFGKTLHFLCTGSIDPDVDVDDSLLEKVIKKCTEMRSRDRYQSFGEVRDAFDQMIECPNGHRIHVQRGTQFCPICGIRISLSDSPEPDSEKKTCPICGNDECSVTSHFCDKCLYDFVEQKSTKSIEGYICSECNKTTYTCDDGDYGKFCNHCGADHTKLTPIFKE